MLVPGWTGSKEDFLTLLPEIAARGRAVVALDQRGQFETAGPDDPNAYSLDELAEDLLAVASAMSPDPVDLVGHSFGGLVAARAVVRRPLAVSSLVLLCSGPGALAADRHPELKAVADALEASDLQATWSAMRRQERASGAAMPPDDVEAWLERRFLTGNPVALHAKTRHLIEAPDHRWLLAETPTPVLVLAGELDDGWPVTVQSAMAADIGAELELLDGLGHSPAVEDPIRTAAHLGSFWDRWSGPATTFSAVLGGATSDVPRARHLVRSSLGSDLDDEDHQDAELLTSELVTNAIIHARPPVVLTGVMRGEILLVMVADAGGGPTIQSRRDHGRGLPIVSAVSRRCGAWTDSHGTTAWFWLRVPQASGNAGSSPEPPSGSSPAHG